MTPPRSGSFAIEFEGVGDLPVKVSPMREKKLQREKKINLLI